MHLMSLVTSTVPGLMSKQNKTNNVQNGQLQVIFGPMFSGKTTELLRRIKRYQVATYSCLVIKYEKDNRYDEHGVATHDRQIYEAVSTCTLQKIKHLALEYDVIGVDEGQFFPDVVEFCEEMAQLNKTVIVAALDGDYQRKAFGPILELVPLAESVVKLNAVCMHCHGEGAFTKRLGAETELEVIGGADKYMAACRHCHAQNLGLETLEQHNKKIAARRSRSPLANLQQNGGSASNSSSDSEEAGPTKKKKACVEEQKKPLTENQAANVDSENNPQLANKVS